VMQHDTANERVVQPTAAAQIPNST
jgi:hypothetical protein